MKTGTRNLVIVASVIVVLGGAVAALTLTGNNKEGGSSSAVSSTPTMDLLSKTSGDVVSMSVKNKKGSYVIIPVTKKAAVSSSSSGTSSAAEETTTYTIKGLEGVPIDSSAAEQVVKNGFSLVATQNLGTVSNPSEFGLTDPQATVEVRFKDGSSYNYKIGSVSATDSTSYYMSGEKSENVYVVSVDSGILENANYFIDKVMLNIQNSSGENDFTSVTLSGKNYTQPVTIRKEGTVEAITSPINVEADSTKYGAVKTALASLTASSVAKANPTAQDLKTYGLDQPSAVAEFTVNKGNYKLMLGAKSQSGYYAMLGGVNVVYEVSADSVSAWAQTDAFALRQKLILLPNIETVKSITVAQNGTESALNTARTKDETKSTEDKPAYNYTVTATNGKKVDYSTSYKTFYQELVSLELLESVTAKPTGTPNCTITYQYFNNNSPNKIEFYKSGDRRYTVVLNGTVQGNIISPDLDKVVYDFQQLGK